MKIDLQKISNNIGIILGFFALFGISGGFITGNIQEIWKAPEKVQILEGQVETLMEANEHIIHFKESYFEFARAITDNEDVVDWRIGINGTEYPVDVRNTAEGYEMAFIRYMYMIYELRYDQDSIRHLLLHDKSEHGSNRVDLYKAD